MPETMQPKQSKDGEAARRPAEYMPLPLVGAIQEKGFSSSEPSISYPSHRVSAPEPRITPFPVARHRSEGPYWKPPSTHTTLRIDDSKQDAEDKDGEQMASSAQPLFKKKKKVLSMSKSKAGKGPNRASDADSHSKSEIVESFGGTNFTNRQFKNQEDQAAKTGSLDHDFVEDKVDLATGDSSSADINDKSAASEELPMTSTYSRKIEKATPLASSENALNDLRLESLTNPQTLDVSSGTSESLSPLNELIIENMTDEQILEAQLELEKRFRPDILEMLKRRGQEKARKQIRDSAMAGSSDLKAKLEDDDGQKFKQNASSFVVQMNVKSLCNWDGRSWTERIEAVRMLRFGLDGNLAMVSSKSLSLTSECGDNDSEEKIPSVTERDILRMDGDPSSHGYTIKEAVMLVRSMVPAQRSAGLRLVSNILNKAMLSLQQSVGEICAITFKAFETVDWQAIWAYALGPEPELTLTLRIALDDSHATAVVTCARAIECLLSSSANEHYFKLCESLLPCEYSLFTAPVFKKHVFQENGLLGECFWKYNVKPVDMYPDPKGSRSHVQDTDATVKDDAFVASQDVAAGLIRMGILPRIRYLLEVERLTAAEDSLFSILIALSRHSPGAADAVMKCPRLINTINELFVLNKMCSWPVRQKAIKLLKVLSIAKKSNCVDLINLGMFERSHFRLLHHGLTIGSAKEVQEESPLTELVQTLHFWRVCVKYGLCISCYPDYYTSLLFWIATPSQCQLSEAKFNVKEASLAEASFRLLEALAETLPVLHQADESDRRISELSNSWYWKFAIPIIESSIGWLAPEIVQICTQNLIYLGITNESADVDMLIILQVISSVLHFLSTVCDKVMDEGSSGSKWLPTFVPKICQQLIRSGMLHFDEIGGSESSILANCLTVIRLGASKDYLSVILNFLYGIVRLLKNLDRLVISTKDEKSSKACGLDVSDAVQKVLQCGLVMPVKKELLVLLKEIGDNFLRNFSKVIKNVDNPRRGGPAPGLGIGWGCQGGGYWSHQMLAAQAKVVLLQEAIDLLSFKGLLSEGQPLVDEIWSKSDCLLEPWRLKLSLSILIIAGPHQRELVERVWHDTIFSESWLCFYERQTQFLVEKWLQKVAETKNSKEVETCLKKQVHEVSETRHIVLQHFQSMWLSWKVKVLCKEDAGISQKLAKKFAVSTGSNLTTVPEEGMIFSCSCKESLAVQYAGQKLPLPSFWPLSPFLMDTEFSGNFADRHEIVRNGIILLHVLEGFMDSVYLHIPVTRIIHCLSSIFLMSDDFFLERGLNSMIGAFQDKLMGEFDCGSRDGESQKETGMTEQTSSGNLTKMDALCKLDFEVSVDERYSFFLDKLMNQFASVSYGDLIFSRQVAIYLRKDVSKSLQLRVWKSLESDHMLNFLPPLDQCCGSWTSYLYPTEDDQDLLKAYASSLASNALDRARARQSVSFSLAAFHVAAFMFSNGGNDESNLERKTFAKNFLLRLVQKSQFEEVLLDLLKCAEPTDLELGVRGDLFSAGADEVKLRLDGLEDACFQYSYIKDKLHKLTSF